MNSLVNATLIGVGTEPVRTLLVLAFDNIMEGTVLKSDAIEAI